LKIKINEPFLTEDFTNESGGIDFLGLRQVNLSYLDRELLPEINNVTTDPGTYCIGTWIPWKFHQLAQNDIEFSTKNYQIFKEKAEIVFSSGISKDTPASKKYGPANNKVGRTQKLKPDQLLTFKSIGRKNSNSIYAAPIYGPSLKYLGFIQSRPALDKNHKSTNILVPFGDEDVQEICKRFDEMLKRSRAYLKLLDVTTLKLQTEEIEDLTLNGLNPGFFRIMDSEYKELFKKKLLTADSPRTKTYNLIIQVLKQNKIVSSQEIRSILMTRKNLDNSVLELNEYEREHCGRWSLFQLRQYQAFAFESMRCAFESIVSQGHKDLKNIVREILKDAFLKKVESFKNLLERECTKGIEYLNSVAPTKEGSLAKVFEIENFAEASFFILTRWWLYIDNWTDGNEEVLAYGAEDRLSQKYVHSWIKDRLNWPIEEFLYDFVANFIFNQHLKVSLSRFDGKIQRMRFVLDVRFVLDDDGIVPSTALGAQGLSEGGAPWMADRLDAFLILLRELDLVKEGEQGFYL
jgi:hypothetical protein